MEKREQRDSKNFREHREHMEGINKYLQGTIWMWKNTAERQDGVQSGDRPVLIISNDTFNKHSRAVNCVSITTILKNSRVHEPVFISRPSHIQCEQLHTIPKDDLIEYMGAVESSTLSNVKAKIRIQFAMGEERIAETLSEIKKNVITANKDQLRIIEGIEQILMAMEKGLYPEQKDVASSAAIAEPPKVANAKEERPKKEKSKPAAKPKQVRRIYTAEDVEFILNPNNSREVIMAKYEFKDKVAFNNARAYLRNRNNDGK